MTGILFLRETGRFAEGSCGSSPPLQTLVTMLSLRRGRLASAGAGSSEGVITAAGGVIANATTPRRTLRVEGTASPGALDARRRLTAG